MLGIPPYQVSADLNIQFRQNASENRFIFKTPAIALLDATGVNDGDLILTVGIREVGSGATVAFTIDVDDTIENDDLGNTRVTGNENEGGQLKFVPPDVEQIVTTFTNSSKATIQMPVCQES